MNLKQTAYLILGLLPAGLLAQGTTPPISINVGKSNAAPGAMSLAPQMPEKGKLSYAIGMFFANNITNSITRGKLTVDNPTVLTAISDVMNGKPTRMTESEVRQVLTELKGAMQAKARADEEEAVAKGQAFLTQFAKAPGVTTLSNGLAYKVITEGKGAMMKENDSAVVAYRGTLVDGTEFDHNDNFTVMRGRVIPGWAQILPLMKVGSKWQVAIPANLGYGQRGAPKIPGNSVLIFDMELKSIIPGATAPMPPSANLPAFPKPPTPGATSQVSGEIIKVPSAEDLKHGAKIEVIKAGQTNAINSQ